MTKLTKAVSEEDRVMAITNLILAVAATEGISGNRPVSTGS
jgi:hypothetical protein